MYLRVKNTLKSNRNHVFIALVSVLRYMNMVDYIYEDIKMF